MTEFDDSYTPTTSTQPLSARAAARSVYAQQERKAARKEEERRKLVQAQECAEHIKAALDDVRGICDPDISCTIEVNGSDRVSIRVQAKKLHALSVSVDHDSCSIYTHTEDTNYREPFYKNAHNEPYEVSRASLKETLQALGMFFGTHYPDKAAEIDRVILDHILRHTPGVNSHGWPVGDILAGFPVLTAHDLSSTSAEKFDNPVDADIADAMRAQDAATLAKLIESGDKLCTYVLESLEQSDMRSRWQRISRKPQDQAMTKMANDFEHLAGTLPKGAVKDACLLFADTMKAAFQLGRAWQAAQVPVKGYLPRTLTPRAADHLTAACALSGLDTEGCGKLMRQALDHRGEIGDSLKRAISSRVRAVWTATDPFQGIDGFIAAETGLGTSLHAIYADLAPASGLAPLAANLHVQNKREKKPAPLRERHRGINGAVG